MGPLQADFSKLGVIVQSPFLGACAITKHLDNQICTFNVLLSWRFPRKTAFGDDLPLCPQGPPLQKRNLFFYCHLTVSGFRGQKKPL